MSSAGLSTRNVGLAILGPLKDLDLVAYLRFASVYRAFDSLEDFEAGGEFSSTGLSGRHATTGALSWAWHAARFHDSRTVAARAPSVSLAPRLLQEAARRVGSRPVGGPRHVVRRGAHMAATPPDLVVGWGPAPTSSGPRGIKSSRIAYACGCNTPRHNATREHRGRAEPP